MNQRQITDPLLQSLEAEKGGVLIYEAALRNTVNPQLRQEWQGYLVETEEHIATLTDVLESLDITPEAESPATAGVRQIGASLVRAIEVAEQAGDPVAAEIVARECVFVAGNLTTALLAPYEQIEEEEDSQLDHSKGWCRARWVKSLGLDAASRRLLKLAST